MAQWIARLTSNQAVGGSSPSGIASFVGIKRLNPLLVTYKRAIGLVVKYLVANEVPRVRFPDGAYLAPVAQLVAPRSYVPMVQGSSPCRSTFVRIGPGTIRHLMTKPCIIRSYHGESTRSLPNSEVKHHWACSVLRWGTTRESQVMYVFATSQEHREVAQLVAQRVHAPKDGGSKPPLATFCSKYY